MSQPGYVYVMFNPALRGLVKIGLTTRRSVERAQELSAPTGVPTPFEVAYEAYFADAEVAERLIHLTLTEKGVRRASNREFFEMEIAEAVKVLVTAREVLGPAEPVGGPPADSTFSPGVLDDLCDYAGVMFRGDGEEIQDTERAIELYRRAANAGSTRAVFEMSAHWWTQPDLFNSTELRRWLEPVAERAVIDAWGYLALIWRRMGHSENSRKCWDRLFRLFSGEGGWDDLLSWAARYVLSTPPHCGTELHRVSMRGVRDALLSSVVTNEALRRRVELLLFPEVQQPREPGRVTAIHEGMVSISGGYTVEEKALPSGLKLREGQAIEFVPDYLGRTVVEVEILRERTPPDWGLIEDIRRTLESGAVNNEERARLLKIVKVELQR